MIIALHDRVGVAYKKLKQMVHFDKNPLTLRRRLAEFECGADFEKRLQMVAEVAASDIPHETLQFQAWLEDIDFDVIPKSVAGPVKTKEGEGSFVTNVTSAAVHHVEKVNYMFDGPIELHLLAVLWLMTEGQAYDRTLSSHCSGSRLHEFVGGSEDHSGYLFKKYHELYAKWRDSGINKARELLVEDRQSVCVVGLDLQEYYYRIELDWEALRTEISRPVPKGPLQAFFKQRQLLGAKLFDCIEAICRDYSNKLSPFLDMTHPDLPETATCLPIGFCASPVIANWYLKEFDDAILESVRPAYYGRYVDDILMVVAMPKSPDEKDPIMSFMDRVLVRAGILSWDKQTSRFELESRPGLFLQKKKCILQYFDADHSTAGLEKFQRQIEENASSFSLLPVDGDESPVAQVAYDLLYDGSVNKFRNVRAVAENRWELAAHIAKQTQLHMLTRGGINKDLKNELFRFFKGRNALDFWDMWERVISFLTIAGDPEGAKRFRDQMLEESKKLKYGNSTGNTPNKQPNVSRRLMQSLEGHLQYCMELSFAVTNAAEFGDSSATTLWRESNLIRHHLVAVPLLNYTNYDGNLASPDITSGLVIDHRKVANTPRFVHFDECLGFVNSGFAKYNTNDSVARANEIYAWFHGSSHFEVLSELVDKE